jgi:hypothetical protein
LGIPEFRQFVRHIAETVVFRLVSVAQLGFYEPQDATDPLDMLACLVNGFIAIGPVLAV